MTSGESDFIIAAGPKALKIIRDEGLRPERVRVMAGAAGGPKWLVLYHLDRILFSEFFKGRTTPLDFIGSSIGAWRFAALSQPKAIEALRRFREAYIHQTYATAPSAVEVTEESRRVLDHYLSDDRIPDILAHPWCRMNLLAARCRHFTTFEHKAGLAIGLIGAVLANWVARRHLKLFFQRTLFHDPRSRPPLASNDLLPFTYAPLDTKNFKQALLASGSIPLVMSGVTNIPGAQPGIYRDGGMVDYHLDLPYQLSNEEMVLMPHFADRIIPGWLDKKMPWRKPFAGHMANVVLIAPSRSFVRQLPNAKIPDRNDFKIFYQNDRERFKAWTRTVDMCRRPAEIIMELIASKKIRNTVTPMIEVNGQD